ncbi:hypothetical protein TELCIR_04716 [Teladorsagia circumcincta]|uniref:Uncharacterized protein n=1 Tax=Teladorsagia circumcincta TaxID=45464 RepID=A0A2G9UT47_TELCI|nr:hypothetical protein TELCIR_04716 [Teladorsagia circumcincta]
MKPMELVKKAMEEWLNNTSSFNTIVYQTSGYMGCAYRFTHRERFQYSEVACVYSRRLFEQWIRKPSGRNCIRDSDCDQFGRHFICLGRYGLCMDKPTRVYNYPFKKFRN